MGLNPAAGSRIHYLRTRLFTSTFTPPHGALRAILVFDLFGAPERIRTADPQICSVVLSKLTK